MRRLSPTKPLSELLPKGREGGSEFARIVDLLLFYDGRRTGETVNLFSDRSGDWNGLDSFSSTEQRIRHTVGYQYKFFASPLTSDHRGDIEDALLKAAVSASDSGITKWIIVTPDDLSESSLRKGGGDVSWFRALRDRLNIPFEIEHWGHTKLQALFLETPALCLFYYPELVPGGIDRRTAITTTRNHYDSVLNQKFGRIEFVGMSVRKEEASRGVRIGDIYIPLTTVAEGTDPSDQSSIRSNPLRCIDRGQRTVILGDPGSGKSTLLRFLALVGKNRALQSRCGAKADDRLPILVTLRKYADELKSNFNLPIADFIVEALQADFSNLDITVDFLRFYLETGQAILLFDGVDELPDTRFKLTIRDRIQALATSYPENAIVVTSRIVGYEQEARFAGECSFEHCQVAPLRNEEIKQFAQEWHKARVEDEQERDRMVNDLMSVLTNIESHAISELACNPLLLTIIVLVHRIDAVLPDQRVLLYQKCVETLLITWHTWKYRTTLPKKSDREDRRNLRRMEAIAEWMHERAGSGGASRGQSSRLTI
ncbi:NACHT domain-containing protein [Bradyrhizobium betae]